MGVPVPTLSDVTAAVKLQMEAIVPSVGTVFAFEHKLEDDVEHFRESVQNQTTGAGDAWYIDLENTTSLEGPAPGENYVQYNLRIRHVNTRVNIANWSEISRELSQRVVDKLEKNTAVFRIGGQPQLRTPETVAVADVGKRQLDSAIFGPQMVMGSNLRLSVEARRWT